VTHTELARIRIAYLIPHCLTWGRRPGLLTIASETMLTEDHQGLISQQHHSERGVSVLAESRRIQGRTHDALAVEGCDKVIIMPYR
jgi:hypothetical protein